MYFKTNFFILLLFEFIQANFQSSEVNQLAMENKDIFTLINDGLTYIHPHPSKKAILLVGLAGSGKTTLAKFITGDNNRLMSNPVKNNSDPLNESSDIHSDYFTDSDSDGDSDSDTTESIYEYYITDIDDDKIGSDITISKTLYPETYVDQTNGEVIIDCPGFEDTRSQAHEIANKVFMKSIFSWATQVKIILVVNHGDVRRGSSRNEFLNLLRFLSILLKDVSHFHLSIGMIVTKVTNEYVNDKVTTDTQMITQIGEYLSSIRSELIERDSENSNIVLVNSLLKQIKSNYPNIAIFRKPYKSGSLQTILEIQEGKKKINKMLYRNLMYANATAASVGFSFSKSSELLVIKICSNFKKKIDVQLKKLNENFRHYYQNQIDKARNDDELNDLLQKEKNCFDFSELGKILELELQLKIFFDILTTNKLHTYLSPDKMYSKLIDELTHLRLLQKLSNDDLTKSDPNWSAIVPEMVQHLVSLSNRYDFIVTKKNVDTQLKYLNKKFRQYYQNQINQARNYDELRDLLQKEKNCFDSSKLDKTLDLESQLNIFFDILTTNKLHTHLNPDAMYSNLINQLTHLKLLQNLSNDDLTKSDPNWSSIVPELVQHLVSLSEWYNFIVTTFERMSQNDVQVTKSNFGLGLTNWASFKTYALSELDLKIDPKIMRKLPLEEHEQKSLTDILKVVSEPPKVRQIQSDTDKCEIVIEGYFVRTSDIEKFMNSCDSKPLLAIYVFAQYTVFFDSSINKDGSELLLSIIAPKWEIIGQQTISLNGINATNRAYTVERDGEAGAPGGQAGTFFGVGYEFTNGEDLKIFTNGGIGGNGHNGENGRNGHDDIDVDGIKQNVSLIEVSNQFTYKQIVYDFSYRTVQVYPQFFRTYNISILRGPEATSGFNGGKQGLGGFNGVTSDIISLNGLQTISLFNSEGADGEPGKGGKGGQGAIVNGTASYKGHYGFLFHKSYDIISSKFFPGKAKPYATDGLDNHSGKFVEPKMTIHLTHLIVSMYRRFLLDKTTDPTTVNPKSSKVFLNSLNSNEKIIKITDLNDLVYEFIALEELNQKRSGVQELTSMYDMLLKMIENCADKERKNKPETFLVTANYLYAAILSRKLNIQSRFSENFVIDVSGFVNHIKVQLETFTELNQEVNIKALQKLYNDDIAKKEKEGTDFVTEQFGVEMILINLKIETAISDLLQEIKTVVKKLETQKKQALEDMEKIEKLFKTRFIFSVLETIGKFVSCFGPLPYTVGTLLQITAGIGKELTKNEPPNPKALLENTNKFKLFKHNLIQDYTKKTNSMILHISSYVSSNPEVQKELLNIKHTVFELAKNSTSLTKIYQKVTQMISSSNTTNDGSLDHLKTSLKFAYSDAVKFYSHFTELTAGQNEGAKIKAEFDARISTLHAFEISVHDSFHTNLEDLINLMESIKAGSKTASTVALEKSRYNIKNTLKDMSIMIKSFTSDFEASEDLVSCIESLENLMMTTMNVYDHLQTYNDQRKLGNLITNINTVKASGLHTGDDRLDTAIRKLDHMLVSNTIQNRYLRAVHAFQQLVFPFAPFFLDEVQLSSDFNTKNETENIQLVISKIKNLQNIIKDQQSSVIHGYDEQIFTTRFDETNPFFVWDNMTNSQSIDNLLKGDKILLKADVLNSATNAVKFNDIRLKLISIDSSNQKKLDDNLDNFNIRMTHMGNSRYRCDDKVFIIANKPQIIEYSFAVKETGAPVISNNVHSKISDGNFLLSPYALWKFQLVNSRKNSTDLSQFYGKIKLVLLGEGQYVKPENQTCQRGLKNFYQLDEITKKIYNQPVIDEGNFF